jgi:hypothetical protein
MRYHSLLRQHGAAEVIVVDQRLAVLLHRLWLTGEMYQPLGYDETMAQAA